MEQILSSYFNPVFKNLYGPPIFAYLAEKA
jgi:hypothetical protein